MFPCMPLLAFCSSDGSPDFVRKSVVDKNRKLFVFSKIAFPTTKSAGGCNYYQNFTLMILMFNLPNYPMGTVSYSDDHRDRCALRGCGSEMTFKRKSGDVTAVKTDNNQGGNLRKERTQQKGASRNIGVAVCVDCNSAPSFLFVGNSATVNIFVVGLIGQEFYFLHSRIQIIYFSSCVLKIIFLFIF